MGRGCLHDHVCSGRRNGGVYGKAKREISRISLVGFKVCFIYSLAALTHFSLELMHRIPPAQLYMVALVVLRLSHEIWRGEKLFPIPC